MRRIPVVVAFACLLAWVRSSSAAPLLEGHLDDEEIRINWQVFEATDPENPRPLADEFTYAYWLEPTGEFTRVFGFDLWGVVSDTSLVVGTTGPLTTTGFISGTGAEPFVKKPGSWRFGELFAPEVGIELAAGERTAIMFVNSPSSPGEIRSNLYDPIQTFCFGCEQINGHPGPLDFPAPGDYDGNGTVETADYDGWKAHLGEQRAVLQGIRHRFDGNADGTVNAADYTIWRDNLSEPPLVNAVPEASTAMLVFAASFALVTAANFLRPARPLSFHSAQQDTLAAQLAGPRPC
jgi:hypothetical protein